MRRNFFSRGEIMSGALIFPTLILVIFLKSSGT